MKNLHDFLLEALAWIGAWFGFVAFCESLEMSNIFHGIGMIVIIIIYFVMISCKSED